MTTQQQTKGPPIESGWYLVRSEDVGEVSEWGPKIDDVLADFLREAPAPAPIRWVLAERPGRGPEYGQKLREELRDGKALVLFADGANAWCFTMAPPVPL